MIWCGTAALLVMAGAGRAQGAALSNQEKAALELGKLTDAMHRVQSVLAESAPDESRALRAGNRYVQQERVEERMAEVRDLLKRGQWDEALELMADIRKHLDVLMKLLLNRDLGLEQLLAEIAQLEAFKKRVEELIVDQQARKEAAARTEALQRHLAELQRAAADIDRLAENQRQLREQANAAGLAAPEGTAQDMAQREGELQKAASDLVQRTRDLEQQHRRVGAPDKAVDSDPAATPAGGGACSGSCQRAAGAMGKAQESLGANQPERSLQDMDESLRQLDAAKQALDEMMEAARRELLALPFEQQAAAQTTTQVDTERLAEEMRSAGASRGEKRTEEAPGAQNVAQAVPKQKAAAGQLKEHKPSQAKQQQQDAKAELERAAKQLEDALAQLRQQLQDEVLRALEERFGAMLAKQKELSARTLVTDRLRTEAQSSGGALPEALATRCAELGNGELALAAEAADALKLLEEEGTTAVFPEIVLEIKADLEGVAARLHAGQTSPPTPAMQAEIEDGLRMLIDALRRTIEDNDAGKAGQCNGEPPLVPKSAEIKLILAMQKRVAKRTQTYDVEVLDASRATDEGRAAAEEIARKQGRVEELTRKLATVQDKQPEGQSR
jgi:hypothetical protein